MLSVMPDRAASPDAGQPNEAPSDASVREAAVALLKPRLRSVRQRIEPALVSGESAISGVHKLRVATRRADAAIKALAPVLPESHAKRVRKRLRGLRRSAADARAADVFTAVLTRLLRRVEGDEAAAVRYVLALSQSRAEDARQALRKRVRSGDGEALRSASRRLLREAKKSGDERPFQALAEEALRGAGNEFNAACAADIRDPERLHELRLAAKRLRYTIEVFRSVIPQTDAEHALESLADLQESLGAANDSHDALLAVGRAIESLPEDAPPALLRGLNTLATRFETQRDDRRAACVETLEGLAPTLRQRLARLVPGAAQPATSAPVQPQHAPPSRNGSHGALTRLDAGLDRAEASGGEGLASPWRVAAIDVGTNTVRLIIAEAYSDGNYRILDDEKETSRLGRGLASTGALAPDAIDAAATTIAHMRRIAEGYGASRIRVVATAAVREASNRAEFLSLVRQRAGLPVEIISAEQEARLAFLSASRAFDLRSLPTAVVDVGGGSTEVVLSAQGVIEEIATIPMGAVRLTEQFGGAEACAGERFQEMREHIRRTLRDSLERPSHELQMLIGSGGTFEAIAKIAMCEERGVTSISAGARGYDLKREDVKRIVKRLRRMSAEQRRAVPGLSSQRADIIVAGGAIVLEALRRLKVDRLRVNDGGIRDGLIRSMIGEHFAPTSGESGARSKARSVRDFAAGCRYDRRHCYHVAGLAMQLFDQLAAHPAAPIGPWRSEDSRSLLEGAAILHDCGYHINYARHHLHSHHLIVHSDMPGFSRREIEVVAAVARYHRGAAPKPRHEAFATLSREDKDLVLALSAVLRIADGLDRTHMQRVRAVVLEHAPSEPAPWVIHVVADTDPVVDIWGAERKSDVFAGVFGAPPRFVWDRAALPEGATPAHISPSSVNA